MRASSPLHQFSHEQVSGQRSAKELKDALAAEGIMVLGCAPLPALRLCQINRVVLYQSRPLCQCVNISLIASGMLCCCRCATIQKPACPITYACRWASQSTQMHLRQSWGGYDQLSPGS